MEPPQFTTRELLFATALIAVGLALMIAFWRTQHASVNLWILGSTTLGAGIFMPIHRPHIGYILGFIIGGATLWMF